MKRHHLYLLFALIVSIFFGRWLSDVLRVIPRAATWISDLIVWYLFFYSLLLRNKNAYPYAWFLVALTTVFFTSFFVNFENIVTAMPGIKFYLKYPCLIYAVYRLGPKEEDYQKLFKFLTAIILLQVPVTFIQRFFWSAGLGSADSSGGTLGYNTTGVMSGVGAFFITYSLYNFFQSKKIRFLVYGISMFAPAAFGSCKFSFFFYPLLIVILCLLQGGIKIKKIISVAIILALIYPVFIFFARLHDKTYENKESRQIQSFLEDPYQRFLRYEKTSSMNTGESRLENFYTALTLSQKDYVKFLFGYGPIAASPSLLGDEFSGTLCKKEDVCMTVPSAAKTWVELGTLGMLLFISLTILLMLRGLAQRNILVFGASFTYFAMGFYTKPWTDDVLSFLFWLFICYAFVVKNNLDSSRFAKSGAL